MKSFEICAVLLEGRGCACCPRGDNRPEEPPPSHVCRICWLRSTTSPQVLSLFAPDLQGTVYISKSRSKGRPAIYRFSLNASVPAPWQMVSPGDGEVPSFQVSQSRDVGPLYQECSTQKVSTRASCFSAGPWVAQGEISLH